MATLVATTISGDLTVDTNTLYVDSTNNEVGIGTTSPSAKLDVRGSAIFNEGSLDTDFRVESNGNTHMLFVDAGLDRVGIGDSSPSYELTVKGSSGDTSIQIISPTDSDAGRLVFGDTSGGQSGRIIYNHSDNSFDFSTSGTVRASLNNSGTLTATAFSGDGSALTNLPTGETAFAYVNFNGTGTITIRDDFNVSSLTDHQTGDYSVNFSSSASSSNYTAAGHGGDPSEDGEPFWTQALSTSAYRGWLKVPNSGRNDREYVMCTIHGG